MAIRSYRDLEVYQRAYQLALTVHKATQTFPASERYELGQQLRRAATSVPANIAEGYGRHSSDEEFRYYLRIAMGSANEVAVLLDMAHDVGILPREVHEALAEQADIVGRQLHRLIERWNKTPR